MWYKFNITLNEMNRIIINLTTNQVISTLLCQLCCQIQKEFDISPQLLDILINDGDFMENCHFLYEQCYGEMMNHLNDFKAQYLNIFRNHHIQMNDSEYEKCGHLIKIYRNG